MTAAIIISKTFLLRSQFKSDLYLRAAIIEGFQKLRKYLLKLHQNEGILPYFYYYFVLITISAVTNTI